MKGKGTAGIGILAAVALIVWAVSSSRPQPESPASISRTIEATTTALGSAYGAALGAQLSLTAQAPADPAALDEEALRAVLAGLMEEAGIGATQDQIQGVIGQYRALASRAQGLLNQVPAGGLGAAAPAGTPADQQAVLAALLSQLPVPAAGAVPNKAPGSSNPAPVAPAPQAPAVGNSNTAPPAPFAGPDIDIDGSRLESDMGQMRDRMSRMENEF